FELIEEAYRINLHIIPASALNEEQLRLLRDEWVAGNDFQFPEGTEIINPNPENDTILPDNIRSEEAGMIRMRQNEWALRLLTNKLWESYLIELDALKKRAAELTSYSRDLFDDVKSFWNRVIEHKKERDIPKQKVDEISHEVNAIFDKLKSFRQEETAKFKEASANFRKSVVEKLELLKSKISENALFKELFDEFKQIQQFAREGGQLSKEDAKAVKDALDETYQQLRDARKMFSERKHASRIENLNKIIKSIEKSLHRDKSDLEYYTKKINHPRANALEIQLVKVKIKMLEEKIAQKEEKLADIRKTLEKLTIPRQKTAQAANPDLDKENVSLTNDETEFSDDANDMNESADLTAELEINGTPDGAGDHTDASNTEGETASMDKGVPEQGHEPSQRNE
ncbi:MAG: hypothetical protein NZ522_01030, partial [Chitinophagales bacterium]|nr:hypothetical protein [Chitinophagales bacterium]